MPNVPPMIWNCRWSSLCSLQPTELKSDERVLALVLALAGVTRAAAAPADLAPDLAADLNAKPASGAAADPDLWAA